MQYRAVDRFNPVNRVSASKGSSMVNLWSELGLRMALGASRRDLMQLVLRRGLGLAGIGIGVGCLVSFYGSRLLSTLLFKVAPFDPTVFSIVTIGLILASLVSARVPALRAAWIEPMHSLRAE